MSMAPDEICRRLGEARTKEMFHSLNSASMKKVLGQCGIPAVRLPSHSSTKKRNEDWANRLWKAMTSAKPQFCSVFLFEWLSATRSDMLSCFLDALGVKHQRGLTDSDFLNEAGDEKVMQSASALLNDERFNRQEVALYLLFLDLTNSSDKFAPLELLQYFPAAA